MGMASTSVIVSYWAQKIWTKKPNLSSHTPWLLLNVFLPDWLEYIVIFVAEIFFQGYFFIIQTNFQKKHF